MTTKEIKKKSAIEIAVDASIAKGWTMKKLISRGYWNRGGLFSVGSWVDAVYDTRTVNNREDLEKLSEEGFFLDGEHGNMALNILLQL